MTRAARASPDELLIGLVSISDRASTGQYADEGVLNLDDANVLKIAPFSAMGSVVQLIKAFGDRQGFERAVHEMQSALDQEAALPSATDAGRNGRRLHIAESGARAADARRSRGDRIGAHIGKCVSTLRKSGGAPASSQPCQDVVN